jgi:hypothetical protein
MDCTWSPAASMSEINFSSTGNLSSPQRFGVALGCHTERSIHDPALHLGYCLSRTLAVNRDGSADLGGACLAAGPADWHDARRDTYADVHSGRPSREAAPGPRQLAASWPFKSAGGPSTITLGRVARVHLAADRRGLSRDVERAAPDNGRRVLRLAPKVGCNLPNVSRIGVVAPSREVR